MSFSTIEPNDASPTSPSKIPAGRETRPVVATSPANIVHAPDDVHDASQCSFPASDPPGWNTLRIDPPHDR